MEIPFLDSYWVLPGRLLAGEYPGDREEEAARRKLRCLLNTGVDFCLDLTEPGALVPYFEWWLDEAGLYMKEVGYERRPIADLSVPTRAELRATLDQLDGMLNEGKVVYVHCWGGIGRTGTVVGCYLVRHGLSGEQALAQIEELRKGTPDGWRRSPETDEQVEMVRSWQVGE